MALIPWPTIAAVVLASLVQTPPVPKPFPQPAQSGAQAPPAKSEPAKPAPGNPAGVPAMPQPQTAAPTGTPTAESLGAPLYPTSEFLESFDAGRGQRYFIFGTNAAYTEIVAYYKNVLKNGGRTVFEAPAIQQWELGKFQEQTMAYPPSIVVKDYAWAGSQGYLFVNGTTEKRFKTVIQIVPATPQIK
ncbi:MAG: hypothetical protein KAY59_00555 [Acidobacteria bacterium]|nr:hypothetical protein [Acidobacteriota bacterium]